MAALAAPPSRLEEDRRVIQRPRAIGSVLPMPTAGPTTTGSLWAEWTGGYRNVAAYGSARSALAALLEFRGIERIWLPAYCCAALVQGTQVCETLWYGVDISLAPDLPTLRRSMRRGDAVLAIDYFGRPSAPQFAALAAARPDVLWIEDRAQALRPGGDWADVLLYSPRKLVGLGEGGLVVANTALPQPAGPPIPRLAQAQIARAADPDGRMPESWFAAFRAQESTFGIDDTPMGELALALLDGIPTAPLDTRRRANAATLAQHLDDLALWPGVVPDFAPLAFPIRVQDCAALAADLASIGIYCARHWAELPSDPARFPTAHRLAGTLLSLPCDHRYGAADMMRIVDAIRALRARAA